MAESQPYERQDTDVLPAEHSGGSTTTTDQPGRGRDLDAVALVAGLLFVALAVLLMTGVDVSVDWFGHGVAWVLLIGAGVALLVTELRRARRRS